MTSTRRHRTRLVVSIAAVLAYVLPYGAARRAHLLVHYSSCTPPYDDHIGLPDPGIPIFWTPAQTYAYLAPFYVFRPLILVEEALWSGVNPPRRSCA